MDMVRDAAIDVVPDPHAMSHTRLTELMKKDAARQEPLVTVIATMLEETITRNEQNQKKSTLPSFHGRRPPLTASAFVTRLAIPPRPRPRPFLLARQTRQNRFVSQQVSA
jgi:hypothetical protein